MSNALKPCPFCGGKATDWEVGTYSVDSSYDMFGCEECGIGFDTGRDSGNEKLWNTRATDDKVQALVDALGRIAKTEQQGGKSSGLRVSLMGKTARTALAQFNEEAGP